NEWVWVVFPWNYWEDIDHLVRQAVAEGNDPVRIRALLKDRTGLDVPVEHVRASLQRPAP
ncbi:MAG: hypothetical protein L3K08_08530, partial [Thermoplasmata archaeon]|nr:hypothetical protein [Thermoplasmata archaeon]